MTELKLTRNGSVHGILVREGESIVEAAAKLERMALQWERAQRKLAA